MRVPVGWLREHVDLPADVSARDLQARLIQAGLEVEAVDVYDVEGPLVVGRVLSFDEEPQKNGKTIRWCRVDVGALGDDSGARGIVCGAANFDVGDLVVVALPGAVLAGGFAIAARKTYGHVSDGMICSLRELGLGDDHTGILVLSAGDADGAQPGDDARPVLGLPDAVLEISVKPDRSYALSMRGVAREASIAYAVPFRDPAHVAEVPAVGGDAHPVQIADPGGADRIVLRRLVDYEPSAPSPLWLRTRLHLAGMRPVSLAVDVTNYVMLETGQPLHAFDGTLLRGPVVVRRAHPGEKLETLDHVTRELDPEDLLITDDRGPIALAGTMGGLETEMNDASTEVVLEAAHFDPVTVARESRRHKLSSEASRRFERGVDDDLGPVATARAAQLLADLGGATLVGTAEVDLRGPSSTVSMPTSYPSQVAGVTYPDDVVVRRIEQVGCTVVVDGALLTVTPPSWRPDLRDPADLAEEVLRLEGYDRIPSRMPHVLPGQGYSLPQRHLLTVARALAEQGYVEVKAFPFVPAAVWDDLGLPEDDDRRNMLRLLNPLSDEEPYLTTSLLPGLLSVLRRNVGRGFGDLALFQVDRVFQPNREQRPAPRPSVDRRPADDELLAIESAVPAQPRHVAAVIAGDIERAGWWGSGRRASWADAVESARLTARSIDVPVEVRAAQQAPWHPGRCAEIVVPADAVAGGQETVVGWAGELHPRVCGALGLPARTAAMEVSLRDLARYAEPLEQGPQVSAFPVATRDVALVVAADVPAAQVQAALLTGGGALVESVRLFDVFSGGSLGDGTRSLAYRLWLRAPDRTLTTDEANAARDAAVAEAARRVGAVLRS